MTPLPLTVIGGYLGAGKTTLINRLLAAEHGLRLLVLVNDFGAINLDSALLAAQGADTIELTNGCVCCTMGADLFQAVGDVLDRRPRPDHLIIEASGIADPARIARLALAEPDLRYAGIVTVVDGPGLSGLLAQDSIAPQVGDQIRVADFVALSKGPLSASLGTDAPQISAEDGAGLIALIRDPLPQGLIPEITAPHPAYVHWSSEAPAPLTRAQIEARVMARPSGVVRYKGVVPDPDGGLWEVQGVGPTHQVRRCSGAVTPAIVAIGLRDAVSRAEIARWWQQA